MKNALWLLASVTALFTAVLFAADPSQAVFWSASKLKEMDKSANAKLNPERHLGTERMIDSAFVAFRNGPGEAEMHERLADLLIIREGSGTVLVGGRMVEGHSTAEGEMRGKAIEGGTKYPVAAGDVLYVPANVVHQFQVEPGQSFTAMVIKLAPKP